MLIENIAKKITEKSVKKLIAKRPDEDFIPYVCHYDKNTIITKNGELLQIIRVTGLTDDALPVDLQNLRDSLRDAIFDNAKDTNFAFWFHTIRRKKSLIAKGENDYEDFFSKEINQKWNDNNNWQNQFVNELYITIITEGADVSIKDFKNFAKSFSYKKTHEFHKNHLEKSLKNLNALTKKIMIEIEDYGAKLLGISEWEGVLYSEPTRFLGKLINLYEERYPLLANDISNDLSTHKIAFANREIEVSGYNNKNFATMLSMKEYHEVSLESLDKILQLPFEFIISQSFNFVVDKKDFEAIEYQKHILEISADTDFSDLGGISNFFESNINSKTDYGKIQTNVMVISDNREDLEKDVIMVVEKFGALGFILVREDIFSEHCFWAQLPANFAFLRRQKLINTLRIAGFASLNNFPSGSFYGNNWGPAVTTFKTIVETPYFFNFHEKQIGHALILGPKESGKTTIANFLLAQARKFKNKIYYFDFDDSSRCFISALSGLNHKITRDIEDKEFLQMNPFSLPKTQENIDFLSNFIKELIFFLKGEINQEELNFIPQIIAQNIGDNSSNFLTAFDAFRNPQTKTIYEKLKIWGSGKLSYIFGSNQEIDWLKPIHNFNFKEIINQKPVLIPVISYLLHRVEQNLDGSPSIIVFDEAFEIFDNEIFAEKLDGFLKRMNQKNCVVIFKTQDHRYIADSKIAKIIFENVATEIYLGNKNPHEYYHNLFGLNEEEIEIVKMIEEQKEKYMFLKHAGDSLILDCDLSFLKEYLQILSCDEITLTAMEEIINSYIEENQEINPQNWMPKLIEILQEINKEREQQEIERRKQEFEEKRKQRLQKQQEDER